MVIPRRVQASVHASKSILKLTNVAHATRRSDHERCGANPTSDEMPLPTGAEKLSLASNECSIQVLAARGRECVGARGFMGGAGFKSRKQ